MMSFLSSQILRRTTIFSTLTVVALAALSLLNPQSAHAACSDPSGNAGDIIYNGDDNLMSYCDDTDWIGIHGSGGNAPIPKEGLYWHWKLDETSGSTALDSVNAKNADWTDGSGDDVSQETVPGKDGTALDFDGVDDSLRIADPDIGTQLDNLPGMSVCNWFYSDTNQTNRVFFRWYSPSNTTFFESHIDDSSGALSGEVRLDNDTTYTATSTDQGAGYWNNAWHHICVTFDQTLSTQRLKVYANGAVIANDDAANFPGTFEQFSENSHAQIGRDSWASTFFDGRIDDVRFYSRTLSATEVNNLYLATGGANTGPVGHWKLDEASGTLADSTASGNDGNATGSPQYSGIGKIGSALYFDGVDDSIYTTAPTGISATQGTVAAWVKPDSSAPGSGEVLVQVGGYNAGVDRLYLVREPDGNLAAVLGDSATGHNSGANVPGNVWSHVALIWDSGNYATYLNGIEVDTGSYTGLSSIVDCPIIGAYNNNCDATPTASLFAGSIDDVRIYNRVLSPNEIGALAAACQEGDMIYNKDHHVPQYCAGEDNWVAMGPVREGIDAGLVGHYKLDETGGTNIQNEADNVDGTFEGDTAVTSANGRVDTALSFDGSDDAIRVPSSVVDDVTDQLTFAVWAKSDGDHSVWAPIISQQSEDTNYYERFSIYLENNPNDDIFISLTTADDGFVIVDSGINMNDRIGEWLHIAGVYNGKEAKIYVDGVEENATAATGNIETVSRDLIIGGGENYDALDQFFGGDIDDARVYNRALSAAEIMALYELGNDNDSTLVGHWKLDDLGGATALDSAGSNDGTLSNFDTPESWTSSSPVNGGLVFDGDDDRIEAGNILNSLSFPFTLSGWIYRAGSNNDYIIATDDANTTAGNVCGSWLYVSDDDRIQAGVGTCGCNSIACYALGRTATSSVPTDQWLHVVAVFNDYNDRVIYMNGTSMPVTYYGNATSYAQNSYPLRIGFSRRANRSLNGILDDVRVYNRGLTAEEVTALYNMGIGNCTNPVGKKGDLIYNDDAGVDALQYCDGANWQMIGKSN